jgi:hypothetical protein
MLKKPFPTHKKQKRLDEVCSKCYSRAMKCQTCQKDFISKRTDAKFCSSTCRSKASRVATDNFATDNSVSVATDKVKINIVPKDEWRRDYLEEHAEFFITRVEETKGCKWCVSIRKQFGSDFMFCPDHLQFVKM